MRRELTTSFARGARLGAWVAGLTLAVAFLGALLVTAHSPGADASPRAATWSTEVPRGRVTAPTLSVLRIDHALLEAVGRQPSRAAGETLFTLGRDEGPPPGVDAADAGPPEVEVEPLDLESPADPPPTPTPTATPAATAAPPAPAPAPPRRAVIVPGDRLYEIVSATFPEDPDKAYSIVMCESSGNATANTGNGYYGMWQFDLPTWQSVGGTGLPSDASVDEQMARARRLYDLRGWAPWGCR